MAVLRTRNATWYDHQKGKVCVNLGLPTNYGDFPTIDHFKICDRAWEFPGASEDAYELIQANGYPSRMPTGASSWRTFTVCYLTDPVASDRWVVTWDGSATLNVTPSVTSGTISSTAQSGFTNPSSAGRIEFVVTGSNAVGSGFRFQILITAISTSVSNIRIFRKSHETRLTNGEKFNPDFLALYAGWGRIRFMDWLATNVNPTAKWEQRTKESHINWLGANVYPEFYAGTATRSGQDFTGAHAVTANPSSWVNGQLIQTCLPTSGLVSKNVTGFTNGSNPTVTAVGHGFSTGDKVYFLNLPGSSLSPSANFNNSMPVLNTIVVTGADTFTIPAIDSTTWGAYGASSATAAKQVTFKCGSLPAKPLFNNTGGAGPGTSTLSNNNGGIFNLVYDSTLDGLMLSVGPIAGGNLFGFPYETMIDLCNALLVDPWFCIPMYAEDDYVTQLATLVKSRLSSKLVTTFEYGNEIWNIGGGLIPTGACLARAFKLWGIIGTDTYHNYYGYRFYQMMGLIGAVFSGQMQRVNRMMACAAVQYDSSNVTPRFQAPSASLPAYPITRADEISIAPYFESNRSTTVITQHVWGMIYGDSTQKQAAITYFIGKMRDDGGISAFTVKTLNEIIFTNWAAVAAAPAPGVSAKAMSQYEGGGGQFAGFLYMYPGKSSPSDDAGVSYDPVLGSGSSQTTSSTVWAPSTSYTVGPPASLVTFNGVPYVCFSSHTSSSDFNADKAAGKWVQALTATDKANCLREVLRSPEFALLQTDNSTNFAALGGRYPSQYCLSQNYQTDSGGGNFGVVEGMYGFQQPAYTALRTFNGQ